MAGCNHCNCALNAQHDQQRRTLRAVLWINAVMFGVVAAAALYSRSTALLSDSLDNLGDAITYAISLWAVGSSLQTKARVALLKGALILVGAVIVLVQVVGRIFEPATPIFEVMGAFSLLGLIANAICLLLLSRHRHEDINMSSVWECSRNDIATNFAVLLTAGAVGLTQSGWPDLLIASLLVMLLLRSGWSILTTAWTQLQPVKPLSDPI